MARSEGAEARTEAGAAAEARAEAAAAAGAEARTTGQGNPEGRPAGSGTESLSRPATAEVAIEACTVSCLTNAQYHASREAFLDTIHRWIMFLVIALGGAALADIIPKLSGVDAKFSTDILVAVGATLAAIDLTFDLSNRARMHAMMKRRYFELLADMRDGHKTPEHVRVCLERFSADEEPQFRVLYLACWNVAQVAVYGRHAHRYVIGSFSNFFKNCFRRPASNFDFIDGQTGALIPGKALRQPSSV